MTLPFVVAIGNAVLGGHGLEGSISAYYYTHMGNYFVGSLCALGVFFLSYNYRPLPNYEVDNYLSDLAGVMAICVALFPTASDGSKASGGEQVMAVAHLVFAGTHFILLGVFSYFFFTRTNDRKTMTPEKRRRNKVYKACGRTIFAALALVVVTEVIKPPGSWHSSFWLETIAVVSFGASWLVKGGFCGLSADR